MALTANDALEQTAAMFNRRGKAGLLRGACHRASHFGPDPLARKEGACADARAIASKSENALVHHDRGAAHSLALDQAEQDGRVVRIEPHAAVRRRPA